MSLFNPMKGGNQPGVNIDPSMMQTIKCASCNGKLFKQAHLLKRIPKLMVGAPSDVPVAFPVWRCVSCNTVLIEFIPDGILDESEDQNEGV